MVQRNLPTGSVRDPRGSPGGSESTSIGAGGARERSYRERIDSLEREIEALEAELKRRDDRLQSVVDRYETILADQRREYERRIDGSDAQRTADPETFAGRLAALLRRD